MVGCGITIRLSLEVEVVVAVSFLTFVSPLTKKLMNV